MISNFNFLAYLSALVSDKYVIDVDNIIVQQSDFFVAMSRVTPATQRMALFRERPLHELTRILLHGTYTHAAILLNSVSSLVYAPRPAQHTLAGVVEGMMEPKKFDGSALIPTLCARSILLHGLGDQGQHDAASALVHGMDGIATFTVDLNSLQHSSSFSMEQALSTILSEVSRTVPCIVFLPNLDMMWDGCYRSLQEILSAVMARADRSQPQVFLASVSCRKSSLPSPLRGLFALDVEFNSPAREDLISFFYSLRDAILVPPSHTTPTPPAPAVRPTLQLAPTSTVLRKGVQQEEEDDDYEERQEHTLRKFRMRIRGILNAAAKDRMYAQLVRPLPEWRVLRHYTPPADILPPALSDADTEKKEDGEMEEVNEKVASTSSLSAAATTLTAATDGGALDGYVIIRRPLTLFDLVNRNDEEQYNTLAKFRADINAMVQEVKEYCNECDRYSVYAQCNPNDKILFDRLAIDLLANKVVSLKDRLLMLVHKHVSHTLENDCLEFSKGKKPSSSSSSSSSFHNARVSHLATESSSSLLATEHSTGRYRSARLRGEAPEYPPDFFVLDNAIQARKKRSLDAILRGKDEKDEEEEIEEQKNEREKVEEEEEGMKDEDGKSPNQIREQQQEESDDVNMAGGNEPTVEGSKRDRSELAVERDKVEGEEEEGDQVGNRVACMEGTVQEGSGKAEEEEDGNKLAETEGDLTMDDEEQDERVMIDEDALQRLLEVVIRKVEGRSYREVVALYEKMLLLVHQERQVWDKTRLIDCLHQLVEIQTL